MISVPTEKGKSMTDELISECFSEFCNVAGDSPCGCDACPYGGTNDDCYAIYEHDKLTKLEKQGVHIPKWIPVTERLPDKDGRFLACRLIFNNPWVDVLSFAKDGRKVDEYDFADQWNTVWYFYDSEYGFIVCNSVTHWMPLPEPPDKE